MNSLLSNACIRLNAFFIYFQCNILEFVIPHVTVINGNQSNTYIQCPCHMLLWAEYGHDTEVSIRGIFRKNCKIVKHNQLHITWKKLERKLLHININNLVFRRIAMNWCLHGTHYKHFRKCLSRGFGRRIARETNACHSLLDFGPTRINSILKHKFLYYVYFSNKRTQL